jgi:hypothetical protein
VFGDCPCRLSQAVELRRSEYIREAVANIRDMELRRLDDGSEPGVGQHRQTPPGVGRTGLTLQKSPLFHPIELM